MTKELDINALKKFAAVLDTDPSILFTEELSFLRKSLSAFGELKLPAVALNSNCLY